MISRVVSATCEMLRLCGPSCVPRWRAGRSDPVLYNSIVKRSYMFQNLRNYSFASCNASNSQETTQSDVRGTEFNLEQARSSQPEDSSAAPSILPSQNVGYLHLIVGPMFSGKTTELLRIVRELEMTGLKIAVIKSDKDARYEASAVVSHDGTSQACFAVPTLAHLRERLGPRMSDFQVFAIDEAQFFPDLLEFCRWAADVEHRTVIVAGLDGDFRRGKFGQMLDAIPFADSVIRLSARCTYCSGAAPFTMRIVADEAQELVGGAESYAPVCRRHYNALSSVRGALATGGSQPQFPQAACCS